MEPSSGGQHPILAKVYIWFNETSPYSQYCGGVRRHNTDYIFLILAHSVYKVWILQKPNKLELWNKLHFKEKKTESIHNV